MRRSVVESNGLVVTKQLVLGNLVGKHRLCFRGSWGLIEGGVSSKAKKNPAALCNLSVCGCFSGKIGGCESFGLHGELLIAVFLEDLLGHGVSDRK